MTAEATEADVQALAREEAALYAAAKKLYALADARKAQLEAALRTQREAMGTKGIDVTIPGVDNPVASYSFNKDGGPQLVVTSSEEEVSWMAEHHPTEVVEAVRPGFTDALLARRFRIVAPWHCTADPLTGEALAQPRWVWTVPDTPETHAAGTAGQIRPADGGRRFAYDPVTDAPVPWVTVAPGAAGGFVRRYAGRGAGMAEVQAAIADGRLRAIVTSALGIGQAIPAAP